jgi:hypothetical protein
MSSSAAQTGVDLLEARQEVLHHLEGVVAVPVAVLRVEQLDVRVVLHDAVERVHALVVERRRDAAQRDDVALAAERLRDVLGRHLAEGGVVAGDVGVLRAVSVRPRSTTVTYTPLLFTCAPAWSAPPTRTETRPAR